MPLLSRAKRKVGRALNSGAMMTDATQTDFCMYLRQASYSSGWSCMQPSASPGQIASPPRSWCPFCCEPACSPCGERHIGAITHIIRTRPGCANKTLAGNFLLEKCIKNAHPTLAQMRTSHIDMLIWCLSRPNLTLPMGTLRNCLFTNRLSNAGHGSSERSASRRKYACLVFTGRGLRHRAS
jgi:hypothetical protein